MFVLNAVNLMDKYIIQILINVIACLDTIYFQLQTKYVEHVQALYALLVLLQVQELV